MAEGVHCTAVIILKSGATLLTSRWVRLCIWTLCVLPFAARIATQRPQSASTGPQVLHLTAEQDHQRMLDLLQITALRRGPDGDPKSPNAANLDKSKANTYSNLPDPLFLNNEKKVTTARMWWEQRRPEIVESFDREFSGRLPKNTPAVNGK